MAGVWPFAYFAYFAFGFAYFPFGFGMGVVDSGANATTKNMCPIASCSIFRFDARIDGQSFQILF